MSCDLDLPSELLSRPLALVGLTGLNVESNPIHLQIWNSFASNNRNERPPLSFMLCGPNHPFPPAKPDRASYEWYIPKGILKRSWMGKHLTKIPGTLVLFYDLEWDEPTWKAKHTECAGILASLRASLVGRGTKIVVVLMQSSPPLNEDILAADRAAAFCQVCELSPKSLFVIPCRSDHLQGYILRLESAFYELCQSSYHLSSKAVRGHRDQLNRTNHGYLFVRHQFKMGFYHELKQDVAMAHKYYSQSYAHVLELRITDANVTEAKIVAGYVGYKVWHLSFLLNLPREAIAHFRSHMDFFRLRIGPPLAKFEHHAWMSIQFSNFGRLFEEAIDQGLPAIQTQHPGFYFQQAAQHALLRKKACYQDWANLIAASGAEPTAMEVASVAAATEFYGQRSWRPARLSLEPSEMKMESDALAALVKRDRFHVDLTGLVVTALTNAVNQFKSHRSPRMKQYLLVQMAEEYSRSGNYAEALTLLEPLLWEYRKDLWWVPLTSLLQLGLRCAYLSARVAEYFTYAVELCSPNATYKAFDKQRLFANLTRLLQGSIPSAPDGVEALTAQAVQSWSSQLEKPGCVATLVTNTVSSFAQVKASFTRRQFPAEQPVRLVVTVRYNGPVQAHFTALSVALNNSAYSAACQTRDVQQLVFEPNQVRQFEFQFMAERQDVGADLQIVSVTLEMGARLVAYLRCEGATSEDFGLSTHFGRGDAWMPLSHPVAEIIARTAKCSLDIEHPLPALRGECYPLTVKLTNLEEAEEMKEVRVTVALVDKEQLLTAGRISLEPKMLATAHGTSEQLTLKTTNDSMISPGGKAQWNVFAQFDAPGNHQMTFQVEYEVKGAACRSTTSVEVETVDPLDLTAQFQTMLHFQPLSKVPLDCEDFVASVTVTNRSPVTLLLDHGAWKWNKEAGVSCQPLPSQLVGLSLKPGEKATDVTVLAVKNHQQMQQLQLGSYSLKWKRLTAASPSSSPFKIPYSACSYDLPAMETQSLPLRINCRLPAHGLVRQSMMAVYVLTNNGDTCVQIDASVTSNDAFMFAGNKQIKITIYPGDDYTLTFNFYPLLSGFVALPPLQLRTTELDQLALDDLVARYVPTHIFVLPQAKEKFVAITAK